MTGVIELVNHGEFRELFLNLFWSLPKGLQPETFSPLNDTWIVRPLARYHGLTAWECDGMPSRREQSEIRRGLLKKYDNIVLVFHDEERQVWVWPDVRFKLGGLSRLTAHRHRVGDTNDVLARRLEAFRVDLDQTRTVSEILAAVRTAFDTDEEAGVRIARLHDLLIEAGMSGQGLEILLTRLLLLFFGDDTGLFGERDMFDQLLKASSENGRDLPQILGRLFTVLDTPVAQRDLSDHDADIAQFACFGGTFFHSKLDIPAFTPAIREQLLLCSDLQWAEISPAIFGSMFQAVLESDIAHVVDQGENYAMTRRALGAHYTSEPNILRAIEPLFLDTLRAELDDASDDRVALEAFHRKLSSLAFLDPACGCGNFLVVTYKEIRLLEIEALNKIYPDPYAPNGSELVREMIVNVDQFFGIEISESAVQISKVALWITDHQLNVMTEEWFGRARPSLPFTASPNIHKQNALTTAWESVISPSNCDFIVGNPPYGGKQYLSPDQKASLQSAVQEQQGSNAFHNAGVLDFVAGWFIKATDFIAASRRTHEIQFDLFGTSTSVWGSHNAQVDELPRRLEGVSDPHGTRAALVTTNSISQGEQVPALWPWIRDRGVHIQFAHRTFQWSNGSPNAAAVHVEIIGLGSEARTDCKLFVYPHGITGEPDLEVVRDINPYLIDAPFVPVEIRKNSISGVKSPVFGNMPNDGGNLLLTQDERDRLIAADPTLSEFIRPFLGAQEFLHAIPRFCIWLAWVSNDRISAMPDGIQQRINRVRDYRLASKRESTKRLAKYPHLFGEIRQTDQPYLLIPRVSSERRPFIPIGYLPSDVIASDAVFMLPNASLYHFGVLSSTMHNAWMRTVAGRLESRYRYSNTLVYNNFPWPTADLDEAPIREAGQAVLDARAEPSNRTLAQLYDPDLMPDSLRLAHRDLDRAVDAAYGYASGDDDLPRVEFLFGLYANLVANAGHARR